MKKEDAIKGQNPKKQKKSQIPYAILLIIGIVFFCFYLQKPKLIAFWIFGIAFGYILQRSRFCFTAAFRDPILTGSTSLTRAVLIAISVATIGFASMSFGSVLNGGKFVGTDSVSYFSILTFIGGILFGIGMVISGGCASGTLMRFGEGFQLQFTSLITFILGSIIGAYFTGILEPFFKNDVTKIYLPEKFGWIGAFIIQFGLILLVYIFSIKWQKKKLGDNSI